MELQTSYAAVQETLAAVSTTLNRERSLREQQERELQDLKMTGEKPGKGMVRTSILATPLHSLDDRNNTSFELFNNYLLD